MPARSLASDEVETPRFPVTSAADAGIFDLSSHARAREALDFGLAVSGIGFNVFVMGDDRTGRMTATMAHLADAVARRPPANDWVYLNNFWHPNRPTPHRLPAGLGRRFRDRLAGVIARLRVTLSAAFQSEAYQAQVMSLRGAMQAEVARDFADLRREAQEGGLELVQGEGGHLELVPGTAAPASPAPKVEEASGRVDPATILARFQLRIAAAQAQIAAQIHDLDRAIAAEVASAMLEELVAEFSGFGGLARWLTELRVDILENPMRFLPPAEGPTGGEREDPERRYAVNLLVDHGDHRHPPVVLESNPTYENLFGRVAYRQTQGTLETDFTLISSGSLHHANGGVLVLRAEALATAPVVWSFLKAALRDQEICIEERQRTEAPPIAGAPKPGAIPLDLKVVIVGSPRWYAMFFEIDPDFEVYFKIKAEIDPDMAASPPNLAIYAGLIRQMAREREMVDIDEAALARLLGAAARIAQRRDRLTARFELVQDLVVEAVRRAQQLKVRRLTDAAVCAALEGWRNRRAAVEERIIRGIVEGAVMIDTAGAAVGQVNGLTVIDVGDWRFGSPVRITARASVGRLGIVNIERDVALGGPIQQKGAMVFQGFLARRFARDRPLSFTCSITFEQTYGAVEGDSASLAELAAVLSDLAELPIHQDVAITGSVSQLGQVQAIGGVQWKIEGFFRVCRAKPGGLTGRQGVIIPAANRVNLVLDDDVAAAIRDGRFHLWSVDRAEDALELLMGAPAGTADETGHYPAGSIYGRVAERLTGFDLVLAKRRELGSA